MKRRRFFGAVVGLFGAPVAAKVLSDASDVFDLPATPAPPVIKPRQLRTVRFDDATATVGTEVGFDEYVEEDLGEDE